MFGNFPFGVQFFAQGTPDDETPPIPPVPPTPVRGFVGGYGARGRPTTRTFKPHQIAQRRFYLEAQQIRMALEQREAAIQAQDEDDLMLISFSLLHITNNHIRQ